MASPLADDVEGLGIWNGQKFVYRFYDGQPSWWTMAKLLWKYGMSPIRTNNLMNSTVETFLRMYEPPNFPFRSLSESTVSLGLDKFTQWTGQQVLDRNDISREFASDIIQASTRVNYGQNLGLIHGLETMVCMATDGAMAVEGGNWQIFAGMIDAAGAHLRLNTSVTKIERGEDGTFSVSSRPMPIFSGETGGGAAESEGEETHAYDDVVLASPFQFSNITIVPPLRPHPPDQIPYVGLYVTLFASPHKLSPAFFNLNEGAKESVPRVVLTTLGNDDRPGYSQDGVGSTAFWSISMIRTVENQHVLINSTDIGQIEYVYKIFSPRPVSESFLAKILGLTSHPVDVNGDRENNHHNHNVEVRWGEEGGGEEEEEEERKEAKISERDISWRYVKRWDAYPFLYPRVTFEDIILVQEGWNQDQTMDDQPTVKGDENVDGGVGPRINGNMYYTSGIESFISTMETSSLMGMNVARLIVDHLISPSPQTPTK